MQLFWYKFNQTIYKKSTLSTRLNILLRTFSTFSIKVSVLLCTNLYCSRLWHIYATKIDGVVCPPNISETVAGRLMKLAHLPRIASTMIKLISKPILLPILLIFVKTIQRIVADPKRFSQSQFSSTTAVARTIAYCVLAHCALQ